MNEIHFHFCQFGNHLLSRRKSVDKFLLEPFTDADELRDHADPFGQKSDEFFKGTRSISGFDNAYDAAPTTRKIFLAHLRFLTLLDRN
jgi:hypothetical protein